MLSRIRKKEENIFEKKIQLNILKNELTDDIYNFFDSSKSNMNILLSSPFFVVSIFFVRSYLASGISISGMFRYQLAIVYLNNIKFLINRFNQKRI